jgi:uncharacterized membrane protein YkvA (DUF1232 family)
VAVWLTVLGVAAGVVLLWVGLVVALWLTRPDEVRLREALRLLPDLLRLLRRLATDPDLPRGVRVRIWLLLAYLASPIDLVPDFVPIIGYADDAVVVIVTLRSVARAAGVEGLRAHWPGSDDGFAALVRLAGLSRPQ